MHHSDTMRRSRLVDLNLLPAELRPHRYPSWYVFGLAAILAGCVLLVPAVAIQHSAAQETARLSDQLALVTGQLEGVQIDIGRERGLRTEIANVEQAVASLRAERASLPGVGGPLSSNLSLVYSNAPPGVSIISTSRSEKEITVSGEAQGMENIIAYARALSESGSFSDVTITQATVGGTGMVTFAIQAAQ
ncbi:MAG TPA: PilN domain-containing protein [Dehalococcoidia bacterium]|nr:PilN domain-containing protein [Dehalococcoidia bacterium]